MGERLQFFLYLLSILYKEIVFGGNNCVTRRSLDEEIARIIPCKRKTTLQLHIQMIVKIKFSLLAVRRLECNTIQRDKEKIKPKIACPLAGLNNRPHHLTCLRVARSTTELSGLSRSVQNKTKDWIRRQLSIAHNNSKL